MNPISRRAFLGAAAAGVAATAPLAGPLTGAVARRPKPPRVTRKLLWSWHERVADAGPRLTGNAAHANYVEFLARQLEKRRFEVQRDQLSFTKWEPLDWSLVVNGNAVPLAFYFPYSGVTPPEGVTAPMVYCGASHAAAWALAAGKIAVVDVPTPGLPVSTVFRELGRYPSDAPSPQLLSYAPSISDVGLAPSLESAKAAGVLGVVCVRSGISDGLAADQYAPFTTPYQGCPAVWTLPSEATRVRSLALQGATATLTMNATLTPNAPTDTLYAILPGTDPHEAIVINTHTDGPNVPEENGGLGILALADHFKRVPRRRRRRSLIFLFATGHFQLPQFATEKGQASSRWIEMHPELVSRAVATLTLEHLGCREWLESPSHDSYGPSGLNEPGYCYTTTAAMRRIWLESAAGTANTRTFACAPTLYFGEGQPFYESGIATMSLIPAMTYLTAAPKDGCIGRLSQDLIGGQIETFAKAVDAINVLDSAAIGKPGPLV